MIRVYDPRPPGKRDQGVSGIPRITRDDCLQHDSRFRLNLPGRIDKSALSGSFKNQIDLYAFFMDSS